MSGAGHIARRVAFLALLCLVSQQDAHAYIDAGTGSYLFQLLLASLFAGAFVVRLYWQRIRTLFGRPSSGDTQRDEDKDEG